MNRVGYPVQGPSAEAISPPKAATMTVDHQELKFKRLHDLAQTKNYLQTGKEAAFYIRYWSYIITINHFSLNSGK